MANPPCHHMKTKPNITVIIIAASQIFKLAWLSTFLPLYENSNNILTTAIKEKMSKNHY